MKNSKTANQLGKATLLEIVKWLYANEFGEGFGKALTDEKLDKIAREMLRSPIDDHMLLRTGIRHLWENEAALEQWEAKEPQRVFDAALDYYAMMFEPEEIEANYPRILRGAIEACDAKQLPVDDDTLALLAELEGTKPATVPAKSKPCFARVHLNGIEFKIWDLARAYWESSGGQCWLSSRGVARQCGISPNTALKYLRQLVARGWFEIVREARPGVSNKASEQAPLYRAVQHAEWVASHGNKGCL